MEPIKLTKETKEFLREYYINLYIIGLKDQGKYEESMYDEIKQAVDYMIERYQRHGNIKNSFSKFMTNFNPIHRKYKSRLILTSKKVELIKNGHEEYLETLIEHEKNIFKLNYRLFSLKNNTQISEEILESGLNLIDSSIREYFSKASVVRFNIYLSRIVQKFYFDNKLKTESMEKNIIIDNKKGKTDERQVLYDKYYSYACEKLKNTTNLPLEKYQLLLKTIINSRIDFYFEGKDKNSTLRNYLETFCTRLIDAPEQTIVKYNLLFDDFYEESISFIDCSIKEYISTYIKEKNIKKISLMYRLTAFTKELAKDYLDLCIEEKRYIPFKPWISLCTNIFSKEQKTKSSFNFDLAINGNDEQKKTQLEILMEELAYLKDKAKEKYIYYTDKSSVDAKIDTCYNNIISMYINGIIIKKDFKRRNPSRYISTRLFDSLNNYSISTKRKFEKSGILQQLFEQYRKIVINYVIENNIIGNERSIFFGYMNSVFDNYIEKGSYSIDIRLYLKDAIDNYDYEFAKNIITIKNFEESEIKVLRRPVIK